MQRVSFGYHISITTVLQKYYLDINPKAISGDEEIEESSSISVEADMDWREWFSPEIYPAGLVT
jgi:hypothetical protein